jgi:3-mercaptopyruvate sulfurtransferase SseA
VVLLVGEKADSSTLAAWTKRLADAGHPVWVLAGGLAAWRAAGGSVEIPDTHYSQPGRTPFLIPKGLCEGNAPAQVFE